MAEVFKCSNCQAALKAVPGQQAVVCEYCGATNVLRKGVWSTSLGVPAAPPPAPGPPPPMPPVGVPTRRSSRVGIIIGFVLVVGIAATFFVVHRSRVFDEWYARPCLIDANGDGVLDIVGAAGGAGSENNKLTIVDGITGDYFWTGERITNDDRCRDPANLAGNRARNSARDRRVS